MTAPATGPADRREPEGSERPPVAPHPPLGGYYDGEDDRRRFLTDIFDRTAVHYDRINALLSFGSGRWYRRDALRRAGLGEGMRVLDVAAGTGPVSRAALTLVGAGGRVTGLDPSLGMLRETRKTLDIPLIQGIAEGLPFRDASFDFLSMGYALRHVADLAHTFGEYHRVLRPGGTVCILDFAMPRSRVGLAFGRLYLKSIVPLVARVVSGSRDAGLLMKYCWDTVENLVPPETVLGTMRAAGFENVRGTSRFGLLSEYVATRPRAD